ncbi:MAG: dihydroorotase [Ruminococcaceae bacterium]|nr:dihydroorotase [Oscillospiraceae bacterium]
MERYLIRGARVMDPSSGFDGTADVCIENGVIAAVGDNLTADGAAVIEAAGLVLAPGLVDLHVHLRDPGQTHKEDVFTGCKAAAAGGVTSVFAMPNTTPALDAPEVIGALLEKARTADAHVYPVGAVTRGLKGEELTDIPALKAAGAAAFSDDGRPIMTADQVEHALKAAQAAGCLLMAHCEELSLVRGGLMNEGEVSREIGVRGVTRSAEEVGTAREIALAAATGCRVHICHVSTAYSVQMIRDAQKNGIRVTGETAPHYIALTDDALRAKDADYRMSPPLRTKADQTALIEGLKDGTLCAIATDHAPHTPEEKAVFDKAPNGSVGMETSLAACLTYLVHAGHLSLMQLLCAMSTAPARLTGIPAGTLALGAPADIVLFDPDEEWTVDADKLHGKSKNCPFKGMTLKGRVKKTFCGGKLVFDADGDQ